MALRGRKRQQAPPALVVSKKRKVDPVVESAAAELRARHLAGFLTEGAVFTLGVGDTGQLGLGSDITERTKPTRLPQASLCCAGLADVPGSDERFVQVVAGGMHTVCLTADGRVFSFGCNDEGALGRPSTDTETKDGPVEESRPGRVAFTDLGVKIRMVSAGDSHSAALDSEGRVWLWGTFRGSNGAIGLTQAGEICRAPMLLSSLSESSKILKIASGQDHLVCLADDGRLLTMGCGEQGQLGRIAERFAKDGGRNGLDLLLHPGECRIRGARRFVDVWAGGFSTMARCLTTGAIYVCGLNNYGQLALVKNLSGDDTHQQEPRSMDVDDASIQLSEAMLAQKNGPLVQFMLTPASGFDPHKEWTQFAIGMHHTLALTSSGQVYSVGRSDYGRLGFSVSKGGCDSSAVSQPTKVTGLLEGKRCVWVGCGEACSFAIDDQGKAYSWGMGSSQQLGQEDEDADAPVPGPIVGKHLSSRRAVMIDAGGQHTVMLARDLNFVSTLEKTVAVAADSTRPDEDLLHTNGESTKATNSDPSKPEALTDAEMLLGEVASTAGATVNSSSLHSCSLVAGSEQSSLSSCNSHFPQPLTPTKSALTRNSAAMAESASTSEPGCTLTADGGSMTDGETKSQQ